MMKKVFILISCDTEDNTRAVCGVFASRKLAEATIDEYLAEDNGNDLFTYTIEEDFLIED